MLYLLKSYSVRHLPVEDLSDCILPPHMEKEITSSRLQMILLSPTLLQYLARNSNVVVGRLLHPDRVIAIMLGVRDSQITAQNRHSLVSFPQWIHLEAKDHDLEFVQTVLYFSTQILQRNSGSNSGTNAPSNQVCVISATFFTKCPKFTILLQSMSEEYIH